MNKFMGVRYLKVILSVNSHNMPRLVVLSLLYNSLDPWLSDCEACSCSSTLKTRSINHE